MGRPQKQENLEIKDEKIKLWYNGLQEDTTTKTKLTPAQRKFVKLFMDPNSISYGQLKASAKRAGFVAPPTLTKRKVDLIINSKTGWNGKLPERKTAQEAVGKPVLVDMAKDVLYKTMSQEDDLRLAQDSAKFVLKSTPEFAERQDMTTDGQSFNGLNITFGNFRKPVQEGEIVEPKKLEE